MWILKTFMNPKQRYLECEYKNNYPTYWFGALKLNIRGTGMSEEIRTYIPIGYVYENT